MEAYEVKSGIVNGSTRSLILIQRSWYIYSSFSLAN